MKKKRFTVEPIMAVLKKAEADVYPHLVPFVCHASAGTKI